MKRTFILLTVCSALTTCGDSNGRGDDGDDGTGGGITGLTGDDGSGDGSGDGNGSGSGGSASGTANTTSGVDCGEADFHVESVPPNLMLVLDKSGSMLTEWDHDDDGGTAEVTRWNSLYNVVEFVVTEFDEQINFGAVLFPSESATSAYGAGACLVEPVPEVEVMPENGANVLDGIPGPTAEDEIQGATPATKGINTAVDHLAALDPEVDRVMVLVTDGAANCTPDAPTASELMEDYDVTLSDAVAAALTDEAIPTYVIGIDIIDAMTGEGIDGHPEANPFLELNKVALQGGVPRGGPEKFFNVANEIELKDAIAEIAGQVISCTIDLGAEPVRPWLVEIEINGEPVPKIDDCATEDGWTYENPGGPYNIIQLCGTACDLLAEFGSLEATFGCPEAG